MSALCSLARAGAVKSCRSCTRNSVLFFFGSLTRAPVVRSCRSCASLYAFHSHLYHVFVTPSCTPTSSNLSWYLTTSPWNASFNFLLRPLIIGLSDNSNGSHALLGTWSVWGPSMFASLYDLNSVAEPWSTCSGPLFTCNHSAKIPCSMFYPTYSLWHVDSVLLISHAEWKRTTFPKDFRFHRRSKKLIICNVMRLGLWSEQVAKSNPICHGRKPMYRRQITRNILQLNNKGGNG